MSKVFIEETTLSAIGDAIRGKTGKTELIAPLNMPTEIGSITTGGGSSADLPDEALNLTGSFDYRFSNKNWDWFIEYYGEKVNTTDISSANQGFCFSEVSKIPFELNFKGGSNYVNCTGLFKGCYYLTELPKITNLRPSSYDGMLSNCNRIREIPEEFYKDWDFSYLESRTSEYSGMSNGIFDSCRSLRKVPMEMIKSGNKYVYYGYSYFANGFLNCITLDELVGLPLYMVNSRWSSNAFQNTFSSCSRLKNITFEINGDGTPKIMNWKNQTIDITDYTGYLKQINFITDYNSGITTDKEVKDDATYQALKNDNDWFTQDNRYSRYNHDSAVNTINSLPDTSAYLATNGGTNTIKFKGEAGSLTDGGAINTLTEEEIAVATAKGWTVSFA